VLCVDETARETSCEFVRVVRAEVSSAENVSFGDVNNTDTSVPFENVCKTSTSAGSDSFILPTLNKLKSFSFIHWNVNGLLSKLSDNDFISFVCSFDFVCLVETFLEDFQAPVFKGYNIYSKPAIKFTARGRRSGGLVCLVKNEICSHVKVVDVQSDYFYAFIIDRGLFGTEKDVLYACVYVPPEGSPYYTSFDVENGIALLEDFLCDCLLSVKYDIFVILSGDLNSRTSNISCDLEDNMYIFDNQHKSGPLNTNRNSEDSQVNNYGKLMLNMCTALSLCILNGMCKGDLQGRYTYITDSGSSVNDYFLMSCDLFGKISETCELCVSGKIQSDHMPVALYVNTFEGNQKRAQENNNVCTINKFIWNEAYSDVFIYECSILRGSTVSYGRSDQVARH
jgi:exonuclease III